MTPQFQDLHPAFTASGYQSTNEEPHLHELLFPKGTHFKRSGGICSAGEIPLTVLLPRSDEVVCIDHSYRSLAYTYLKALMLHKLGVKKLKALFLHSEPTAGMAEANKIAQGIPEVLRKHLSFDPRSGSPAAPLSVSDWREMRKEMFYLRDASLQLARKRLDKLTLLHGDLNDLKQFGEFDCLYVSNAFEHSNRNKLQPTFDSFLPLVREGGMLIFCDSYYGSLPKPRPTGKFEVIKTIKGLRTTWSHVLATKPAAAAAALET